MTDLTNMTLNSRYRIAEKVGEGGQAEVYKAADLSTSQDVAIKVLRLKPGEEGYARHSQLFQIEAQVRVPDSGVMAPVDSFSDMGHECIVMPFIDGLSLEGFAFSQVDPLSLSEACRLGAELFERLHAVHQAGWVHRDVKAGNVLVDARGT
ncbi:MAG: protein kinase domain-containing protein, partial [Phycisphaerae bacterium]